MRNNSTNIKLMIAVVCGMMGTFCICGPLISLIMNIILFGVTVPLSDLDMDTAWQFFCAVFIIGGIMLAIAAAFLIIANVAYKAYKDERAAQALAMQQWQNYMRSQGYMMNQGNVQGQYYAQNPAYAQNQYYPQNQYNNMQNRI